jgi:hypothetical protein
MEGRILAEPVVLPRAFCCTRAMGISGYPVFPAPSILEGGVCQQSSGALRRENTLTRLTF